MGEAKRRKASGQPPVKKRQSKRALIWGGSAILLALIIALAVYLATPGTGPTGSLPDAPEGAAPFPAEVDQYGVHLGDPDAPVVVREFADYQCPGCANFARLHGQLKEQYIDTGKVRLVFFELPLPQHANAMPAAQAARCAGDQDNYWGMNEKLFSNQSSWSRADDPVPLFADYARELGLNEGRLQRCMAQGLRREQVEDSLAVARQLRVASTPTVIVDNIPVPRPGWEQLSGIIDRQLDRQ